MEAIYTFFRQGGFFMYFILLTAVFGLSIIVERVIVLFRNRIDTTSFVNRVIELIEGGRISKAIELCNLSKAALPRITKAGLEEQGGSPQDIQNAIELSAMSVIPKLEKRTGYLSMVANIATLLGLLGTILGLIQSFQAVAHADASQKAALLAGGISVALNTTAFGLMVAIPCMISYSFISEKTNELIDEINENVSRIYQKLISTKQRSYEPQEASWKR